MKKIGWTVVTGLCLVAGGVFAGEVACDYDFEHGGKGWSLPKPNFSIKAGEGRNGSSGLVCDCLDTNKYQIACSPLDFIPGQTLRVTAWIKDELSKRRPGFCVEFRNAKGGYIGGSGGVLGPDQKKEKGVWQKYVCDVGPIPPDAARLYIQLYAERDVCGRCVFDDIQVESLARERRGLFFSNAPADRAFSGTYRFSATTYADLRPYKPEDIDILFQYKVGNVCRRLKPESFEGGIAEVHIDAETFNFGSNVLMFFVRTKDGKTLDEMKMTFTRLEKEPNPKVRFDEHRRLVVDGKVTYPLLIYSSAQNMRDPRYLPAMKSGPFKMTVCYTGNPTRRPTREDLDYLYDNGIRTIVALNNGYARQRGYCRPVEVNDPSDEMPYVARVVREFKDHPGVLGWYLYDEPEPATLPRVRDSYKLVTELDGEHPSLVVLCHGRFARDAASCSDVVGLDCYPVPGTGTEQSRPANLAEATAYARSAMAGLRGDKPFWFVPQSFPYYERARFPTVHEMTAMVWQGICAGADGVLFYSLGEMLSNKEKPGYYFEPSWKITCEVARGIEARTDFLLSTEKAPEVTGLPKELSARAWRLNGRTLLVVCNLTHQPVKATIKVDGKPVEVSLGGDDVLFR